MRKPRPDADTEITTLPNGVRVLAIRMPQLESACVSVFVHSGSAHESRSANGIGHVIEHMVFKGTHRRDARRINLDAERLGAEVNAHTAKDHSAFHMQGLGRDAPAFVRMLGDIVCHASFPEDEVERERRVLLEEFAEDEDDPMSTAFRLFDLACFGTHPVARPVIGTRRNIEAFTRGALIEHVRRLYTGANVVVGAAGGIDADAVVREVASVFAALPRGEPNRIAAPAYAGGVRARRVAGSSQAHVVLGFPIPALGADDPAAQVAAALFGEGMSSPLLASLRERLGLAYYTACSADLLEVCGQFVVEASTAPKRTVELLGEVMRLLHAQAEAIDPVDLARAHKQIAVRRLRDAERAYPRLEDAALDLLALGRVRPPAERLARLAAVTAPEVRQVFERMLSAGASLAMTGRVGRGVKEQALGIVSAGDS